jgi:hypothetical protein
MRARVDENERAELVLKVTRLLGRVDMDQAHTEAPAWATARASVDEEGTSAAFRPSV